MRVFIETFKLPRCLLLMEIRVIAITHSITKGGNGVAKPRQVHQNISFLDSKNKKKIFTNTYKPTPIKTQNIT